MKANELREIGREELKRKVDELRRELFSARIAKANNQLKDLMKFKILRREIARVLTVLRQKGES